ncbi:MAG: type II toxin-antitoxin system VapC family toxin [Alphaproteobacteria bacterium]|jgi:hypothetical protein
MMVVLDSSYLLAIFSEKSNPPRKLGTEEVVDLFKERINGLISELSKNKTKIGIPTPALSEILIKSNSDTQELLDKITKNKNFVLLNFDLKSAIELAELARKDPAPRTKNESNAKLKFDRQILAIAITNKAEIIYTNDENLHKKSKQFKIESTLIQDLPIPNSEKQLKMDFQA